MELFFQFVLATTFFDAFYDTGNSKKRIIKKNMKNSGDARNFRSEISKSDIFHKLLKYWCVKNINY